SSPVRQGRDTRAPPPARPGGPTQRERLVGLIWLTKATGMAEVVSGRGHQQNGDVSDSTVVLNGLEPANGGLFHRHEEQRGENLLRIW
ncbi:MAG: hypothetical protein ACE5JX_22855, partial [Acidobacteriota bacterium]